LARGASNKIDDEQEKTKEKATCPGKPKNISPVGEKNLWKIRVLSLELKREMMAVMKEMMDDLVCMCV